MERSELLRIAHLAADAAAGVIAGFATDTVRQHFKPDGSRVTEADIACEAQIRHTLAVLAPGEAILGEETGGTRNAGDRWIVDPIDGTENFSRGNPVWATLIAREIDGEVAVAVVNAPALGRRWWAVRGAGAFTDGGRPLRVSTRTRRDEATFCYGGLHECPTPAELDSLVTAAGTFRCAWGWGNFWGHVQVAEGAAEAALSYGTELWDVAAPALLVTEAGGTVSDVHGGPSLTSGSLMSSNGPLHRDLVRDLTAPAPIAKARRP